MVPAPENRVLVPSSVCLGKYLVIPTVQTWKKRIIAENESLKTHELICCISLFAYLIYKKNTVKKIGKEVVILS